MLMESRNPCSRACRGRYLDFTFKAADRNTGVGHPVWNRGHYL